MSAVDSAMPLSGARKAAIFLMGVGDNVCAEVLRRLAPAEVQRISAEITATPAVLSDQMLSVFREFEVRTAEARLFALGGAECAKRLVEHAFGSDSAQNLLPSAVDLVESSSASLFQQTDPQQLGVFLRSEHPQTIAVLLSSLPARTSGPLLAGLATETQQQVVLRMACLDRVSPEALQKVSEAIGAKLKGARKMDRPDGVRAVAALLNQVPAEQADALLRSMEEQDPALAANVRERMFVFEDIVTISAEGMKSLIARIDRKILTLALKGTSAKTRSHFTAQMSQRAAEMLAEDMEALGPVRVRDVKAAQSEVIAAVRALQQEGALSVGGSDEYVD